MKFKKIKICIALWWLVLFSTLLYGMIFISTSSFEDAMMVSMQKSIY